MEETPQNTQLDIKPNATVEVLTPSNQTTFVGKVVQFSHGVLTLRSSTGDDLPPVLFNKQIKLRFYQGTSMMVVSGKICGSSAEIWKVDRLQSQFTKEKRTFFRQRVDLQAQVRCVKPSPVEPQLARSPEWKPCRVEDISASGILIHSWEPYQAGDRLSVMDLKLADGAPFSFFCRVLRSTQDENSSRRICGCQIETLPPKEQDRLVHAIFAAQRRDIRNRRSNGF